MIIITGREIKFRAWDEDNKRMLTMKDIGELDNGDFFDICQNKRGDFIGLVQLPPDMVTDDPYPMYEYPVFELQLEQFTGLHDKNGNDIYHEKPELLKE